MWPQTVDWQQLRFGLEIEFVGADPRSIPLLPGWKMALDEHQVDETGQEAGSELQSPPLTWSQRSQIQTMLSRLRAQGARANWSCGLHVHVGLEPWGADIVLPLLEAALAAQDALAALLQTAEHRRIFCPPVTPAMREAYRTQPGKDALRHRGRPQSHRCGLNAAAWYDFGTVEMRYANGSVDDEPVLRTAELALRFVAAVGAGKRPPGEAPALAAALGAPTAGYPPPEPAPLWHWERLWLEEALIPALTPLVLAKVPQGEIHHLRPTPAGLVVAVEQPDGELVRFLGRPRAEGWGLEAFTNQYQ